MTLRRASRLCEFKCRRPRLLLPRRVSHALLPPDAIVPYLREAGFGDTVSLRNFIFENSLITAFMEQWHPETHTFYLPWGCGVPPWATRTQGTSWETDDPKTLRQYARSYILLLIMGYLLTDKSNNLVHLRWLPLLQDFERCHGLSWGSAVLAWIYHSLCFAAHRGTTDIAGCTPLLISWIYQRFFQWCPPDRQHFMYPMAMS
ncbi:hypothetical protein Ahy_B02g059191 [Arachis hypogaea]|uniref:Aminotransferase-like plant mobile domain-containing protein n=1 Tax=Arachis hypogaea TaxID=3818 RepID=A0A445AGA5_ARAHY|nr:hypothetical protein Ahy_B02g059191 [Arachis hypogaea]